jgi:hypothetical protein
MNQTQNVNEEFLVECAGCKQQLKNWVGSTPCCGALAYVLEDGKRTNIVKLFASINDGPIKSESVILKKPE